MGDRGKRARTLEDVVSGKNVQSSGWSALVAPKGLLASSGSSAFVARSARKGLVCVYRYMYIENHIYIYVYTHMYACVYVCMYVCMYIYIYMNTQV